MRAEERSYRHALAFLFPIDIRRQDRANESVQGSVAIGILRAADQPRPRQFVITRERIQSFADRLGHAGGAVGGAGAQRHDSTRHREQIFDAVTHLSQQQRLLLARAPALGDVSRDLRSPDDPAARVLHGRDGERNVDQASVLAPADRFVVVDALAAADALQDARLLIEPTGRHEHGDRLANRFQGGVPKEPLGAAIPTGDDAVEVF